MNKKMFAIVGVIAVVIAIVLAVFLMGNGEDSNPETINDVVVTVMVDGEVQTGDYGKVEGDEVTVDSSVIGNEGWKTLEEIEALGYSVSYKGVGNEVTVNISRPADVGSDTNDEVQDKPVGDVQGEVDVEVKPEDNEKEPVGDNSDTSDKTDAENKPGTDDKDDQTSKPADDDKQDDTSKEDKTPEKDDEKQDAPVVNPNPDKPVDGDKPVETDPVHQHSYKDTVVKPTCTEKGYTTHTCSCGESYKDNEVAALGHKYTNEVIAPTPEAEGYTFYTCKTCGHSYKDNFVDKIADSTSGGNSGNVADSDLNGDKVGVTYVNAEDPNNLGIDNLGNTMYNIYNAGEGTVIMHSDLNMVSNNANENISHFFETMNQIDGNVKNRKGTELSYMGDKCGSYKFDGSKYVLEFNFMSTMVGRNVFLNALNYFGGDMGVSVFRMFHEHYFFRSNDMIPISNELAAKYGLTITMLEEGEVSWRAKVSNGMDTWEIKYGCAGYDNFKTFIYIPA